jgi:aminoglycoside phosphotransferase (APT) family kinase protein
VERFRGPLTARLPHVDDLVQAVVRALDDLDPSTRSLVHGDLIAANIHVDEAGRPVAVLDFGFMTTIGDPAFDAAVTASLFDMYGPRAAGTEAVLDAAMADRFGHDAQRLAIYRAAYALATSNCFSASGSDGHFDWCVRMVQRPAILDALPL